MRHVLVLLALIFVACGAPAPVPPPNDSPKPEEPLKFGQLELQLLEDAGRKLNASFGDVAVGETASIQVRLKNVGDGPLELRGIDGLANAGEAFSASGTYPLPVPAGEERVVSFSFAPVQAGFRTVALSFRVHGERGDREAAAITLHGWGYDGVPPPPSQCNWTLSRPAEVGAVMGCAEPLDSEFVIACNFPSFLQVRDIEVLDENGNECPMGGCPHFSVLNRAGVGRNPATTLSVPLLLRYGPETEGEHRAQLRITYAINNKPAVVQVPVLGRTVEDAPVFDTFSGTPPIKSDVLFVVDNGVSMAAHATNIATNVAKLASRAGGPCIEAHYAVVTSGAASGALPEGAFVTAPGEPTVINSRTTLDFAELLVNRVDVSLQAGLESKPLSAMARALDPAMLASTNTGFRRSDAALSVFVITDRSDTSPGTVADYLTGFDSDKRFSVAGGLNDSAACGVAPDDGRLKSAAEQTNGLEAAICADWTAGLIWIDACWESRTTFNLTRMAAEDPSVIVVRVEGVVIPPTDSEGSTIWTYDRVQNAIVFDFSHRPNREDDVEVEYARFCEAK